MERDRLVSGWKAERTKLTEENHDLRQVFLGQSISQSTNHMFDWLSSHGTLFILFTHYQFFCRSFRRQRKRKSCQRPGRKIWNVRWRICWSKWTWPVGRPNATTTSFSPNTNCKIASLLQEVESLRAKNGALERSEAEYRQEAATLTEERVRVTADEAESSRLAEKRKATIDDLTAHLTLLKQQHEEELRKRQEVHVAKMESLTGPLKEMTTTAAKVPDLEAEVALLKSQLRDCILLRGMIQLMDWTLNCVG